LKVLVRRRELVLLELDFGGKRESKPDEERRKSARKRSKVRVSKDRELAVRGIRLNHLCSPNSQRQLRGGSGVGNPTKQCD